MYKEGVKNAADYKKAEEQAMEFPEGSYTPIRWVNDTTESATREQAKYNIPNHTPDVVPGQVQRKAEEVPQVLREKAAKALPRGDREALEAELKEVKGKARNASGKLQKRLKNKAKKIEQRLAKDAEYREARSEVSRIEGRNQQRGEVKKTPLAQAVSDNLPSGRGATQPVSFETVTVRQTAGPRAVADDIVMGKGKVSKADDVIEYGSIFSAPGRFLKSLGPQIEKSIRVNQAVLSRVLKGFAAPERLATILARSIDNFEKTHLGRGVLNSEIDEVSGAIKIDIGKSNDEAFDTAEEAEELKQLLISKNIKGVEETARIRETSDGFVVTLENNQADALTAWRELGYVGKEINNIQDVVPGYAAIAQQADDAHRGVAAAMKNVFDKDLRKFVKKKFFDKGKNFRGTIEHMQSETKKYIDANGNEAVKPAGTWYTVDEFADKYYALHGKVPTAEEMRAYAAYRQLNDFAYELKVKIMSDSVIARGDEVFEIKGIYDTDAIYNLLGHKIDPKSVLGKSQNEKPIMVMGDTPKYFARGKMTKADLDDLDGYDIISIHPSHREDLFKELGQAEAPVQYIAVPKGTKRREFGATDIASYMGGGRKVDESPFYIKVGGVVSDSANDTFRLNDTTLFGASSATEAKEGVRKLNELATLMRNALKTGEDVSDEAIEAIGLKQVGIRTAADADAFMKENRLYSDDKVIGYVGDREILDIGDLTPKNPAEKASISNNMRSQIFGQRTTGIKNIMGTDNTIADPLSAMVKSMNIVNEYASTTALRERALAYFNREFGKYFKNTNVRNPYEMLTATPDASTPIGVKNAIDAHQRYLKDMIGMQSDHEAAWSSFSERMMRWVFDRSDDARNFFGRGVDNMKPEDKQKLLEKRERRVDMFGTDPFQKVRSLTFHTTLGMLNPGSFIMQWVNAVNIMAIAGRSGAKAAAQALPLRMALISRDPEVLDSIAKHYDKMGFKSEQDLKDAVEEMWLSGLDSVGGTHVVASGVAGLHVQGKFTDRMKTMSTAFFDQGEILNRMTARLTANNEWLKANPGKSITGREAREWISKRTHDLTLGMSRSDTQLLLRESLWSIPLQFWSYPMRLTSAMFGTSKMFTKKERARLAAANFLMWGGAGIPIVGAITDHLVDKYDMDVETAKFISNGMFDTSLYVMSDGEIDSNMSDRVGLHMFYKPIFDSLLNKDKSGLELLGGAAAGRGGQMFGAASAIYNFIAVANAKDADSLTDLGIKSVAALSSGFNNVRRTYLAMQYGKIFSRSGNALAGISRPESIAMLFGIPPQAYADIGAEYDFAARERDNKKLYKELYISALRNYENATTDEQRDAILQTLNDIGVAANDAGVGLDAYVSAVNELDGSDYLMRRVEDMYRRDLAGKNVTEGQKRLAEKQEKRDNQ